MPCLPDELREAQHEKNHQIHCWDKSGGIEFYHNMANHVAGVYVEVMACGFPNCSKLFLLQIIWTLPCLDEDQTLERQFHPFVLIASQQILSERFCNCVNSYKMWWRFANWDFVQSDHKALFINTVFNIDQICQRYSCSGGTFLGAKIIICFKKQLFLKQKYCSKSQFFLLSGNLKSRM